MKFTLIYDGELPAASSGNSRVKEKWAIRKQLHPQLKELWQESDILKSVAKTHAIIPKTSYVRLETHHSMDAEQTLGGPNMPQNTERLNLCDPIPIGERMFIPLVRESFALKCGLHIKFLRKEPPGQLIYQGGDMDNRLKVLFDALSVPNKDQMIEDKDADFTDPIYCLLEDDNLVSNLSIDTQKLLTKPNASQHEVRLIIDVDIRVVQARLYNQAFLGE